MKNSPQKPVMHPPVIEQILASAPPHTGAALRAYMDLLVVVLEQAKVAVDAAFSQRDRAVGFLDEVMTELQAVAMPDQDKASAESTMDTLMAKLTKGKS